MLAHATGRPASKRAPFRPSPRRSEINRLNRHNEARRGAGSRAGGASRCVCAARGAPSVCRTGLHRAAAAISPDWTASALPPRIVIRHARARAKRMLGRNKPPCSCRRLPTLTHPVQARRCVQAPAAAAWHIHLALPRRHRRRCRRHRKLPPFTRKPAPLTHAHAPGAASARPFGAPKADAPPPPALSLPPLQEFLPPMEDVDLPPLDEFLAKVITI